MRWWKKWSFVIILGITGIFYYAADESLMEMTRWESVDPAGREKPEEEWQLLESEETPGSVSGAFLPEEIQGSETASGEGNPAQEPEGPRTGESEGMPSLGDADAEGTSEEPQIRIGRVEDDYFSDALFLGDSRTVGMYEYGELEDIATFYASKGLTIYKLFDAQIVELPGQKEKITVEEALQHQSFRKIYIMVGINEMGRGTVESFAETYGEAVAHLQELQPEAVIYIQAILKVTAARSDQGDYINNEGIEARNEALSKLADGKKVFYLDPNQAVCDEDGGLVQEYTFDGVHLKAKYIGQWKEFLKDNAVLLD